MTVIHPILAQDPNDLNEYLLFTHKVPNYYIY